MKKRRTLISLVVSIAVAAIVLIGFFMPLGSYTTRNGCPSDPMPTQRLSLVTGQTLENVKRSDILQTNPLAGCAQNMKYIQYLFPI